MAYDEQLAERIRRGFGKARVRFEEQRMMCVGVDKDRLMARIDPAVYESALCKKGCVPMDFTGRPMRGFVFVNPAGLATDDELDGWLKLALEFNPKAQASRKRTKKSPAALSRTVRPVRRNDVRSTKQVARKEVAHD